MSTREDDLSFSSSHHTFLTWSSWQEFQLVVVLTFELCRKFIDLNINTFLTKLIVSVSMKVFNILSGEETEALNTRVMVHFSSNGSP